VSQPRPRAVIADDHVPTRRGVRQALEDGGFEVCGEAGTAPEAVRLAVEQQPDVCLLDINMPGGGISAAEVIADTLPQTRIVMLTASEEDEDLFDALRVGADGYLLKDTDPERLPLALRGVLSGEAALPRQLAARLVTQFQRRRRRPLDALRGLDVDLTEREWEVLQLIRDERPSREIALALGITQVTVRRHVGSIVAKLRVRDRGEAVALLRRMEVSRRRTPEG
jgi:DNA-binding NarL/FixJ family response regulator